MVTQLAVMNMTKHYMNYWGCLRCGFPTVTLSGTLADWRLLSSRAEELIKALCHPDFAEWWLSALLPTLDRIVESYNGAIDPVFWNAMVKRCGIFQGYLPNCGYTGWLHAFFPLDISGGRSELCVRYDSSCDYVRAGVREIWQGERSGEDDKCDWMESCDFPCGIAKVPIQWINYCSGTTNLIEVYGGFVGYTQDSTTGALMPMTSWFLAKTPTENVLNMNIPHLEPENSAFVVA